MKIFYGFLIAACMVLISLIGMTLWTSTSIMRADDSHVMGNPDGDLTVVEFLDYRCPYCQEIHPIITQAVRRDGNIRYIVRPISSNDKNSLLAGAIVYAAARQGQFEAVHNSLISDYRAITDATLVSLTNETGMDFDRFTEDLLLPEVRDFVLNNDRLFLRVEARGTPFFVIDNKITYMPEDRMPNVDDFLRLFAQARAL